MPKKRKQMIEIRKGHRRERQERRVQKLQIELMREKIRNQNQKKKKSLLL